MSILLPLYIYPWPGVWDPLYTAAQAHPEVNFTVILNPCSGPCLNSKPEAPYITEIPKLKTYSNVRTLGYVATNYTNKPIDQVVDEIWTYANWTTILGNSRMAVDGIFFDEIPGLYDWRNYSYLTTAMQTVRGAKGLGHKLVVHNPGITPDRTWNYLNLSDITVVFEDAFLNWVDKTHFDTLAQFQNVSSHPKSQLAVMVHSLPNVADGFLTCMVKQLEAMADYFFVTSVSDKDQYWHSFSPLFAGLVSAVGADNMLVYNSDNGDGGDNNDDNNDDGRLNAVG